MARLSIALFLTLAAQQKCNFLPTREQVLGQVEQGLVPYFPHVRTILEPNGAMIAMTCADLGLEAIKGLPAMLQQNTGMQQLRQNSPFLGLIGIRGLGLGFPDYVLMMNIANGHMQINAADAGYRGSYAIMCHPGQQQ